LMALAATGRYEAAERMLDAMRAFSHGRRTIAAIVGDVALPVGEAVLAHRRGQYSRTVDLMRPVLDAMHRLGGTPAQQDVLNQLFLDPAVKAERADDVRLILARVAERHGTPQTQRVGYADAARQVSSSGNGGGPARPTTLVPQRAAASNLHPPSPPLVGGGGARPGERCPPPAAPPERGDETG